MTELLEHVVKTARHTTFYLACGPEDGTPIIFLHGWPELSIIWRRQLEAFGLLGFRAIAPDMRGYGRSTIYDRHEDYRQELIAQDMIELLDSLGKEKAFWVGHDYGSAAVWALAQHHADRCHGVVTMAVPFIPDGFAPETLIPLVDRSVYPEEMYPAGQWDYQLHYRESFEQAIASYDGDVRAFIKACYRRPDISALGKPYISAMARSLGGLLGGGTAPDMPRDDSIISETEEHILTAAFESGGFFGPTSWYMNDDANCAYAARGTRDLALPVLFMHCAHDPGLTTVNDSLLAGPMRAHCADLTEVTINAGHWTSQEEPEQVNAALARWLAARFGNLWPQG